MMQHSGQEGCPDYARNEYTLLERSKIAKSGTDDGRNCCVVTTRKMLLTKRTVGAGEPWPKYLLLPFLASHTELVGAILSLSPYT